MFQSYTEWHDDLIVVIEERLLPRTVNGTSVFHCLGDILHKSGITYHYWVVSPVKSCAWLMAITHWVNLEGSGTVAVVIKKDAFKFMFLLPYKFYNKFINFNKEIVNTNFRFENIYNFLKLLCFTLRNCYCTIPISILLIKVLKTSRFTVFLLSIA